MAHAIEHPATQRDPRAELHARLENAPAEHAEALLASLEVLQGLHDSGTLEIMRGLLGSKDRVLEIAVGATGAPGSTRAVRNMLLLSNMVAEIDPAVLKGFTQAVPRAMDAMVNRPESPGLWRLIRDFLWNRDFRRGMAALNTLIAALGRSVSRDDAPPTGDRP